MHSYIATKPGQSEPTSASTIFLSYDGSHALQRFAEFLYYELKNRNQDVFLDTESLHRADEIVEAVRGCKVAVFVLSESFFTKKWAMIKLVEAYVHYKKNKWPILLPLFYSLSVDQIGEKRNASMWNNWRRAWDAMATTPATITTSDHESIKVDPKLCRDALMFISQHNGMSMGTQNDYEFMMKVADEICRIVRPDKPPIVLKICRMMLRSQLWTNHKLELDLSSAAKLVQTVLSPACSPIRFNQQDSIQSDLTNKIQGRPSNQITGICQLNPRLKAVKKQFDEEVAVGPKLLGTRITKRSRRLTNSGEFESLKTDQWIMCNEKPFSEYNWQDVITSCFTGDVLCGSSFKCNSMQCMDIANYLKETASFRKQNEERIRVLECDQAIMEFCHAIVEAKLFLQDCSAEADFWKNAYNTLTKLHTGEAYDVLLHNLIWSKAGLDVAILYAGAAVDMHRPDIIDYSQEIKKRVEECKRVLSRYRAAASTQARLNTDRADFYFFMENPQIPDDSQKKCLTFLVQKSKAYQLLQSDEVTESGGGGRAQQLDVFKIDPHDIGGEESFLGHGSYGYVCRRTWLGQTVAAKVFRGVPPELFKNEASLHAGLQNPFIVHMVGWFTEKDGSCTLVMELAPTDLQKVIDGQHFISRPAAVDIMLQISKGMEYLHNRRVIHRDLKPKNVLLQPSFVKEMAAEGYARVKLCDFGIAKVKELSAKDKSKYTTFKAGTSYYRAPEVLFDEDDTDKSKYTRKADVFSFAITCSEILAGKTGPACYQTSTRKIREKMLANVRPELPPDCPSHLAELIKSCWDTDPNCRPSFRRVSNTLTYIKFILMRFSDVQRMRYISMVSPFDEEELKRRVSEDEEFEDQEEMEY